MPKQKQFKLTYFILQLKWARNAHPLSYHDSVNQEYLYKLQQFDYLQLLLSTWKELKWFWTRQFQ